MIKKGKFIVIEGSDGSGKGTQFNLLYKKLKKETKAEIIKFDFPRYKKFFGKLVGRYLTGEFGGMNDVNPHLAALPYALDRWSAKDEINNYLSQGKIVLSNRYYLSSMAHQTARMPSSKRDVFMKYLEDLELKELGIPRDDITIFLYVPPKISQKLVDLKAKRKYINGKKRDIHEASLHHLKRASDMYVYLAKKYNRIIRIDCCDRSGNLRSIEDIHSDVWDKVSKRII